MHISQFLNTHGIDISQPIGVLCALKSSNNDPVVEKWLATYHKLVELFGQPDQFAHRWNWFTNDYGYVILDECYLGDKDRVELMVRVCELHWALAKEEYDKSKNDFAWNTMLPRGVFANTNTVQEYSNNYLKENISILKEYTGAGKPLYFQSASKRAMVYQLMELNKKRDELTNAILSME